MLVFGTVYLVCLSGHSVFIFKCISTFVCIYIYVCVCLCVYTSVPACVAIHMPVCISVLHVSVFVWFSSLCNIIFINDLEQF